MRQIEKCAALVAFAGIDGSGKTTQARLLAEWLGGQGFATTVQAGPTPSFARTVLTDLAQQAGVPNYIDLLGPDTTRLIGCIVKYHQWSNGLLPALAHAEFAVVDRYVPCAYASVRALGAANEQLIRTMFRNLPPADLTILLELPAEIASRRIEARGVDHEDRDYLARLARAYRELPEATGFVAVDATAAPAQIHAAVRELVCHRFPAVLSDLPDRRRRPGNRERGAPQPTPPGRETACQPASLIR